MLFVTLKIIKVQNRFLRYIYITNTGKIGSDVKLVKFG